MIRHRNSLAFIFVVILIATVLVSCSNGGSTTGSTTGRSTTGTLELSLIDSTNPYKALYITINEVRVHHDGNGWITLSNLDMDLPKTVNLLELVNGAMVYLGSTDLATGHYSQMRLILEDNEKAPQSGELNILDNLHPYFNYLIDAYNDEIPLKVPSGGNTGIKLVNGFNIEAQGSTELVLDFDALKSVVQAGKSGKWLLKPTIKVVETVTNTVSGKVTEAADSLVELEGAMVSAQKNDASSVSFDKADWVTVVAGTESDQFGDYFMYLPLLAATENPYNIVVTMAGYETACQQLPSNKPMAHTADFALTALAEGSTGTLQASVLGLVSEDDSALFSIRQYYNGCGDIEVARFSVVNTPSGQDLIYSDPITLPTGIYQVVISAEGQPTQEENLVVEDGQDYLLDIDFMNTD